MPAEKRNHFLDIDESDDDGSQGYDSEAEQPRKGTSKRRKLNQDDSDEDEPLSADDDVEEENDDEPQGETEEEGEKAMKGNESKPKDASEPASIPRPLTRKNLVATEKAVKRSGVIYVSRVPPFSEYSSCSNSRHLPSRRSSRTYRFQSTPNKAHANALSCSETRHNTVHIREVWKDQQSLSESRGCANTLPETSTRPEPEEELS